MSREIKLSDLVADFVSRMNAIDAKFPALYESLGRKYFTHAADPNNAWQVREAVKDIEAEKAEFARLRELMYAIQRESEKVAAPEAVNS